MKMPWQRKAGENGEGEVLEVQLPDEFKSKLDSAVSKTDFDSKLGELQASIASISSRFQREDEEKARAAAARRAEETKATKYTKEQVEELMATDPVAAVQRLIQDSSEGQTQVLLTVRADSLRREVFEDSEKYPYYSGDMKQEIDKLLEAQTLAARNDRSVIEHAYYSTLGKHHKELADGKLKSRFASSDTGIRTSTGRTPGGDSEELRPMTEDDKKAARILGFSEQEYQKMLKEEGVGYV